jgi:hypothetical protein
MKLPTVYYQIKKIRAIWFRSKNPQTKEMIEIFDEYLKKLEEEALEEENEYIG